MATSLRTIAEKAGVSVNTVSKILNRGRDDLYKKETVERVRKAASEAGYRRSLAARMLLTNSSRMVGFVTLSLEDRGTVKNAVVYPFLVGATDYLAERDYHLVLVPIKELLGEMPRILRDQFFDALILQLGPWDRIVKHGQLNSTPALYWDSGKLESANCLYRDEELVGTEITRRLLALGHRRIAFAMTSTDWAGVRTDSNEQTTAHFSVAFRYRGYQKAMQDAGLPVIHIETAPAVVLADRLLEANPTAVIILGGSGYGAFEMAARRIGWPVPERLSIVSCDIDPSVQGEDAVKLGGYTYDRYKAGQFAGEMLIEILQSEQRTTPSRVLTGSFRLGETLIRPPASLRE